MTATLGLNKTSATFSQEDGITRKRGGRGKQREQPAARLRACRDVQDYQRCLGSANAAIFFFFLIKLPVAAHFGLECAFTQSSCACQIKAQAVDVAPKLDPG